MKLFTYSLNSLFLVFLTLSFSQCSNTKNAMKIAQTIEVKKDITPLAYYQHWVAGVRGGGSGTNLFISKTLLKNKEVDSVYFREKVIALEANDTHYVGYFKGELNQLKDRIMDLDSDKEYENKAPVKKAPFPFDLNENEAVISYTENEGIKYMKLTNIVKKEMLAYPSAPRPGIN